MVDNKNAYIANVKTRHQQPTMVRHLNNRRS